jgi:putative ABC transport system permease protein
MLKAGLDPSIQLIKTEDLLAISMQAFDDTFVITDGLNVVTLLIAALSLACAIIVLMNDVRPQNMLIRSMGVSAMKTQLLALFQYLLLCLLALVFATPFGILLSWILISDINYQAFSWTYPLIIAPLKIAQIYTTSLLLVTAIIAIPLLRAGRTPLIEDIRWVN